MATAPELIYLGRTVDGGSPAYAPNELVRMMHKFFTAYLEGNGTYPQGPLFNQSADTSPNKRVLIRTVYEAYQNPSRSLATEQLREFYSQMSSSTHSGAVSVTIRY
jgi:hypothetical protein